MKLSSKTTNKMVLSAKEIAMLAVCTALLFVLQVTTAFLPNIELVSVLIILYTLIFRWKTLYIIYTFALLEGVFYGFGIWWIMYLYVWTILFLIVHILRTNKSTIIWSVVSGIYGLSFGFLCAIPYLFVGGIGAMITWWAAGIPFDIIHGISNFFITLVLYRPILNLLNRIIRVST